MSLEHAASCVTSVNDDEPLGNFRQDNLVAHIHLTTHANSRSGKKKNVCGTIMGCPDKEPVMHHTTLSPRGQFHGVTQHTDVSRRSDKDHGETHKGETHKGAHPTGSNELPCVCLARVCG